MISFFTHSGGAGLIRGEQIASYLSAKLNPKSGFESDVCIYVKCIPPEKYPRHTYIDVVEDSAGLRWVKNHPEVKLIASSYIIYAYLDTNYGNDKFFIPQHHCNFERRLRTRTKVDTVGIVGNKASFQHPLDELEKKLRDMGIELKTLIKKRFSSREEIVDFYKQIDIQFVWRPGSDGVLRNPLKLINAMSFGIPTVAWPEEDFVAEFDGYFSPAKSIDELLAIVKRLKKDNLFYKEMSDKALSNVEDYHIENIAKLYLKLE